jgi:hypothetical protein
MIEKRLSSHANLQKVWQRPGELPVQARRNKSLGLTVPMIMQMTADDVIE